MRKIVVAVCLAFLPALSHGQTCNVPARPQFAGHNFPLDNPPVSQPMTPVEAFPNLPNFNLPVFITYAPDGTNRLFVVEKIGRIWEFDNDPNTSTRNLFLDLIGIVDANASEMGLLGLAFDPHFTTNHYFYVNYTATGSACQGGVRCTKIARFTVPPATPNAADKTTELDLLEYQQPFDNHKAGMLAFGPDGFLWIAAGDGGSGGDPNGNAQNVNSLLGKLLRIDPSGDDFPNDPKRNYKIPPGNPYASGVGGAPEWWARGMRNPWRFSFDRLT
ncbi:MAG TPA: PQQ-dependent sugar dehydrogenase, partial [Myxococcota bacterium]|nr:PQQ-dependent sugar dehydrogenase [Myxococcota bacterium]